MSLHARPTRRTLLIALGLGGGTALLAGCGRAGGSEEAGLSVVTSAYPLAYLVTRIGGQHVALADLSTPGADAHGLELSVKQALQVEKADLVLQIPGFQTPLDEAIASHDGRNVLDVSSVIDLLPSSAEAAHEEHGEEAGHEAHEEHDAHEGHDEHAEEEAAPGDEGHSAHDGHDHGPLDPHFWHDPLRMAALGEAIASRLAELDPAAAEDVTANAAALREELEALDAELAESYGTVPGERPFVTSHAAYTYLAERYGLHQIGITGVDPEAEPSPQRLLALEGIIAEEGVGTIFFESTASPKVARTLASNLGLESAELDNLETQRSAEADYPAVMRSNCAALVGSWS